MAKLNMLPILALGAAALLMMKKKGEPTTATNGEKANGNGNGATGGNGADANGDLPKNLNLVHIGDFNWGATVLIGTDATDKQADQVIDIVAVHAKQHPSLPFVVTKASEGLGFVVTVKADGLPYWKPVNTPAAVGLELSQLLNEHIPKPSNGGNGNGNGAEEDSSDIFAGFDGKVLEPYGTHEVQIGEPLRLKFGDDMQGIGYTAPVSVTEDMTRSLGPTWVEVQLLRAGDYEVKVSFAPDAYKSDQTFRLVAS